MMDDKLQSLTATLLGAAKKAGATAADAMAIDGTAISVDVRQGKLEQAERAEGIEIGLRVLIGQRQASVSASDISARTIADMAERAVAMAREAPVDDGIGLADPGQLADLRDGSALELSDPSDDPSAADLEGDARRAEGAALAVKGISQVDSASASYARRRIQIAMSNGFAGGYARSSRSISAVTITGEGLKMERDWAAESRVFQSDLPPAEEIGRLAAERTLARAGARQPKTGAYPVIFDERVASSLIGHVLSAVNGAAIVRGASWLRDGLGKQILPKGLSIIDDPHRRRLSGSRPFDAEGLATAPREVVANGTLMGWTLDLATARRLGMTSTASAVRGTSGPPSPSNGNIALTQGRQTRDDLIADMGTGLLITSFLGATINSTTGDYSRGAAGFWVENGQIAHAVNECTIAGNLREMALRITPANDARLHMSYVVPSLLVEGLTLAGQ
jgi:PmbA protein